MILELNFPRFWTKVLRKKVHFLPINMVLRSNFKMHLTIHRSSNSRSVNTSQRLFCDKAKKALLTSNTILRIVLSELNKATGFHCLIYYLRQCSSYGLNRTFLYCRFSRFSVYLYPKKSIQDIKVNSGHI